ncbi:hypothetical protein H6P81_009976 [Aristolochia fimbriata]|uniref:Aminotransferase-like plant mobile domain-containing protein n=1 Tax=Aristolochia fimbriata TaxID=158543 RepID=A0AAV7EQ96_ARIFI|nr:hypothetical protein H6P81_009976 [Aristolochia fimbriata]
MDNRRSLKNLGGTGEGAVMVVMEDTPLLYDQDSHRSKTIWHEESSVVETGQTTTSLVERWRSKTNTFHLANDEMTIMLEDVVVLLGLRVNGFVVTGWNIRRTNATKPCGNLVLYRTQLNHQWSYQVNWQSYLDFLQHLPAICVEGRCIWLSRTPLICFEIVELHVPDRVMLQFGLEQLGCVRNVVERVNHREALDPSSADPYLMEIGHYYQSVLHSLPLLEGAIVDGEVSHAGEPSHVVEQTRDRAPWERRPRRRPTSETTTRVEDPDEVPAAPEPMVQDLPPEQTPELEPNQPTEPEPSRHPLIQMIYTRRQKLVHQSLVLPYDCIFTLCLSLVILLYVFID